MPARKFLRLLKDNDITAISSANNYYTLRQYENVRRKKIVLPPLESVGFDQVSSWLAAPVMTAFQPKREMGRAAARILIDLIEGRRIQPQWCLEPQYSDSAGYEEPLELEKEVFV